MIDPTLLQALTDLADAEDTESSMRALAAARSVLGGYERLEPLLHRLASRTKEIQRLRALAGLDELTGIANRRAFHDALGKEVARQWRRGGSYGLVLIDLDGLKLINDRFGHAAGDRAIVATANACVRTLRESDLAARLGGDEFGVLLPETIAEGAFRAADRLREQIESEDVAGIALRTSIGVAVAEEPGIEAAQILARADAALYTDKRHRKAIATDQLRQAVA